MQRFRLPHSLLSRNLSKMNRKEPSLIFCILMDLIGFMTYSVPVLGEFGDVLWAPISGLIFFFTFGGWKGAVGGMFNFLEEIIPGTDFVPSFTMMYFYRRMNRRSTIQTPMRIS